MEEEKLLCILNKKSLVLYYLCITFVLPASAFATTDAEDITTKTLMDKIVSDSRQSVIENSQRVMEEFLATGGSVDSQIDSNNTTSETRAELLVFVSTSMPEKLLESYYKEAAIYGATLVFNGLPGGSFKELSLLINRLSGGLSKESSLPGSIIDDGSFAKFGVDRVPTIVLKQEKECFEIKECDAIYDRIVGNVGIRGALNQFMDSGELKSVASNFIKNVAQKDAGGYR